MGLYPKSMVGVPGEAISNMAPPTLCIVALTLFQVGVVLLLRDAVNWWIDRPGAQELLGLASSKAITVYRKTGKAGEGLTTADKWGPAGPHLVQRSGRLPAPARLF